MSKPGHLDTLRKGSDAWNAWRKLHPTLRPDLSDGNLSSQDLSNIDLSDANLEGTDLSGANLSGTDITNANFDWANLTGANLSGQDLREYAFNGVDMTGANLSGTNLNGQDLTYNLLSGANLSGADLCRIDLSDVDLSGANLSGANLSGANLSGTNLSDTDLRGVDLSGANLSRANLSGANLSDQDLSNKDLSGANLSRANLLEVNLRNTNLSYTNLTGQDLSNKDLSGANLSGANLSRTLLLGTNFKEATLTDCIIYGIAAWNVQLEESIQKNLIITQEGEATITVDNLKVAQFIYLMLNNQEIRDVINTLTTKSVLILGRFTPERKATLDALRDALRTHNYLPILFDFEKPKSRDFTETVRALAHLARFIIADLTDHSSIPLELQAVVPDLEVPVQPLLQQGKKEFSMFSDLKKHPWVLPLYTYQNLPDLLASLETTILVPAEKKAEEIEIAKAKRTLEP